MPAAPVCLLKNWPKQLPHFWPSGAAGTGWVVYTTRLNISRLTVTERGGRPGPAATLWAAVMCEEPACWSSLRRDLLISSWCYAAGRARPVMSCFFGCFLFAAGASSSCWVALQLGPTGMDTLGLISLLSFYKVVESDTEMLEQVCFCSGQMSEITKDIVMCFVFVVWSHMASLQEPRTW